MTKPKKKKKKERDRKIARKKKALLYHILDGKMKV